MWESRLVSRGGLREGQGESTQYTDGYPAPSPPLNIEHKIQDKVPISMLVHSLTTCESYIFLIFENWLICTIVDGRLFSGPNPEISVVTTYQGVK